jgi:hypothetical protein
MYGAFGKNNNHVHTKITIVIFDFLIFGIIIETVVKAHGINAKNRFQFKNKKTYVSEYMYLNIEKQKQNKLSIPRKAVSFNRFVSLNFLHIRLLS